MNKVWMTVLAALSIIQQDKITVTLKDATLYDSVEMIFKNSSDTSYIISAQAKEVILSDIKIEDKNWYDALIDICNKANYKIVKSGSSYLILPREGDINYG